VWQGHGKELLKSEYMTHLQTSSLSEPAEVVPMLKAESSKTHGDEIEFREGVLKTPKQLIEEEKRAKGNVDLHHWQKLKEFNGSNVWWMGMFVIMIFSALAPIGGRKAIEWVCHRVGLLHKHRHEILTGQVMDLKRPVERISGTLCPDLCSSESTDCTLKSADQYA